MREREGEITVHTRNNFQMNQPDFEKFVTAPFSFIYSYHFWVVCLCIHIRAHRRTEKKNQIYVLMHTYIKSKKK